MESKWERERQRQREREGERQTDRQTDREERQRKAERERQREEKRERKRGEERKRESDLVGQPDVRPGAASLLQPLPPMVMPLLPVLPIIHQYTQDILLNRLNIFFYAYRLTNHAAVARGRVRRAGIPSKHDCRPWESLHRQHTATLGVTNRTFVFIIWVSTCVYTVY